MGLKKVFKPNHNKFAVQSNQRIRTLIKKKISFKKKQWNKPVTILRRSFNQKNFQPRRHVLGGANSNLTSQQIRKTPSLSQFFILQTLVNQFMYKGQKHRIEKIFTRLLISLADTSFCSGSEAILEAIYNHYSLMGWRVLHMKQRTAKLPLVLNLLTRHRKAVRFFKQSILDRKTTPLSQHILPALKLILIRKQAAGLIAQARQYEEIKVASKQKVHFRFQSVFVNQKPFSQHRF